MNSQEFSLSPTMASVEVIEGTAHDTPFELDHQIDAKVHRLNTALNELLGLAVLLKKMKDTRGYTALGFEKWTSYLESKPFGRAYQSYLLRLGKIEDTTAIVEKDMSSSLLVQYLSSTDYPDKVPVLIDSTWDQVKGLPIRQARQVLQEFVNANRPLFKKEKKAKADSADGDRPESNLQPEEKRGKHYLMFVSEFEKLGFGEQTRFTSQMRKFLRDYT